VELFRTRLLAEGEASVGWYAWYAIERVGGARGALVGSAGFFGPPQERVVELGYSICPEHRGRGIATEVVLALVAHAFTHGAVDRVRAHVAIDNTASIAVLRRAGFARVEEEGIERGHLRFVRAQGA
jgi:RimJ/RimL family protein N-acetyltransferase